MNSPESADPTHDDHSAARQTSAPKDSSPAPVPSPDRENSPRLHEVTMADYSVSTIRLFSPSDHDAEVNDSAPLVVIWPGFGMGARYFDPMGRELAGRGYRVVTGELRGQGTSTARATRKHTWGYHHLASQDFPATIRAAKEEFDLPIDHPTIFLCHSLGGQIAPLFFTRDEAKELNVGGFMGVGAGTPYLPGYSGKVKFLLRLGTRIIQATVTVFGYQPSGTLDITNYGRQAKHQMLEWVRYSRTNRQDNLYGQDRDYEQAKDQLTVPVLLTRFVNDRECSLGSVHHLAQGMPHAQIEIEEFSDDITLGHNRWARQPQTVADRFEKFLDTVTWD